jgi:hypothetical protein
MDMAHIKCSKKTANDCSDFRNLRAGTHDMASTDFQMGSTALREETGSSDVAIQARERENVPHMGFCVGVKDDRILRG